MLLVRGGAEILNLAPSTALTCFVSFLEKRAEFERYDWSISDLFDLTSQPRIHAATICAQFALPPAALPHTVDVLSHMMG